MRRRFRVSGRVQGVGFRMWTLRRARDLGLRGTVANERDGSVVVEAEGEPAALDRLAKRLEAAGIDPKVYTGFAWGQGIERMVMMKNGIEDVRLFHSGRLDFLRQFK